MIRFIIKDILPNQVKRLPNIPKVYQRFLHQFGKKRFLESSDNIDILYQESDVNGCGLANHTLIVHETTTLIAKANSPLSMLVCLLKGSITVNLAGITQIRLVQGQCYLFQISDQESEAVLTPGEYEFQYYVLSKELLLQMGKEGGLIKQWLEKAQLNEAVHLTPQPGIISPRLYDLIRETKGYSILGHMDEHYLFHLIAMILITAIKLFKPPSGNDSQEHGDRALFHTVKSYIDSNPNAELDNNSLADNYRISVSKLKYGFKGTFRESIQHYVRRTRMEKAQDLILTTHEPLNKIAELVGYKDYTYFTKVYSDHFGHSPSSERTNGQPYTEPI
jgi:AraC-like DNA-binding protein